MTIIVQMIGWIIYYVFIYPLGELLKVELWILPVIAQYNNFIYEVGVINGWVALRDLSNMLFIIVFLIIAFATILKIQSYGYKALLKKFLIIAILINFSKTLVGFVIDIFQIIMLTFVSAIKDIAAGNIAAALGLGDWGKLSSAIENANGEGLAIVIVSILLMAIMLLVTVVVVGMYIVAFTMRIVKIWIYIVLSPIAFFANSFPGGQKYFNDWLGGISKELLIGPALAFFLWLSFSIVGSGDIASSMPGSTGGGALSNLGEANQPNKMINFVIGISMLIGSLKIAQQLGAAGAGAAENMIKTGANYVKGKAMGGARMLYSGTSGEGMLKGGLSRITSAGVGGTAGLAGKVLPKVLGGGLARRMEMRVRGKEDARKARKGAYVFKKARDAGVTDSTMSKYLGAGFKGVGDQAALADIKGATGEFEDEKDVLETIKVKESMGDTQGVEKIRRTRADAHDSSSAEKIVGEKGAQAFKGMDTKSIVNKKGELTEGAKEITKAMLEDKGTDISSINEGLSGLSDTVREAILKGMSSVDYKVEEAKLDKEGKPALDNKGKPMMEKVPSTSIDATTPAGKQNLMSLNNSKTADAKYTALTKGKKPKELKTINQGIAKSIDKKSFAKMPHDSELFKAIASGMKSGKVPDAIKGLEPEQIEVIVTQQVEAGNIKAMVLNPTTSGYVTEDQKDTEDNQKILKDVKIPGDERKKQAAAQTTGTENLTKAIKELSEATKKNSEKKEGDLKDNK